MRRFPPERIVCLTVETVETLYLLGEERRIVGVTGYATRPARVRREKPRISGFATARIGQILALEPDLVLAFSDVQAEIVAALARDGAAVHLFNQRDLAGSLAMVRALGALVGAAEAAEALAAELEARLDAARERAARRSRRPRIYVEEWDEPMIAGIQWTSELVEAAGGVDVFAGRAAAPSARERIVAPHEVVAARPDIVLASWCGKRFRPDRFAARPGFSSIPAVRNVAMHAVPAPILLAPGPALFTDGLSAIERIVAEWADAPAPRRAVGA